MTRTRWIVFALICIVLLGGLVWISNSNRVDVSKLDKFKVIGPTEKFAIGDHVLGDTSQKVLVIEYGDFQCPGCGALHPVLKPLVTKYKDQIGFVFRNFPLTNIHPNALAAAAVAEAAGKQDKYYEMHDFLYQTQNEWKDASSADRSTFFNDYAKKLGLNVGKFTTDLSSEAVTTKIRRDQALGGASNVSSTPSVFLNGKRLNDDTMKDPVKIEEAIKNAILESGQKLPEVKKAP